MSKRVKTCKALVFSRRGPAPYIPNPRQKQPNTKGALEKRINGSLKNGWLKSARKEDK